MLCGSSAASRPLSPRSNPGLKNPSATEANVGAKNWNSRVAPRRCCIYGEIEARSDSPEPQTVGEDLYQISNVFRLRQHRFPEQAVWPAGTYFLSVRMYATRPLTSSALSVFS
jgi:hypothetical protein